MRLPFGMVLLVAMVATVRPAYAEPSPVTGRWRFGGFKDVALLSLFAEPAKSRTEREFTFACGTDPLGIGVMIKGGPDQAGFSVSISHSEAAGGPGTRLRLRLRRVDHPKGLAPPSFIYSGLGIDRLALLLQSGAGLTVTARGRIWIRSPARDTGDIVRFIALCRSLAAKGREMRE